MNLIIDVKVLNLDRAVQFYTAVLGLVCRRKENEWAALLVGDAEIHLYTDGGVTGHVEFYVNDIEKEVQRLIDQGVIFISGLHKPGALSVDGLNITTFPWGQIAFFKDTEGNELALVKDIA